MIQVKLERNYQERDEAFLVRMALVDLRDTTYEMYLNNLPLQMPNERHYFVPFGTDNEYGLAQGSWAYYPSDGMTDIHDNEEWIADPNYSPSWTNWYHFDLSLATNGQNSPQPGMYCMHVEYKIPSEYQMSWPGWVRSSEIFELTPYAFTGIQLQHIGTTYAGDQLQIRWNNI